MKRAAAIHQRELELNALIGLLRISMKRQDLSFACWLVVNSHKTPFFLKDIVYFVSAAFL